MIENKNPKRTSIAQLAEFGLIDHLTKNFSIIHPSNLKGIGDNDTVLDFERKKSFFEHWIVLGGGYGFDNVFVGVS
jgi:thiamine-monophosphate kinase